MGVALCASERQYLWGEYRETQVQGQLHDKYKISLGYTRRPHINQPTKGWACSPAIECLSELHTGSGFYLPHTHCKVKQNPSANQKSFLSVIQAFDSLGSILHFRGRAQPSKQLVWPLPPFPQESAASGFLLATSWLPGSLWSTLQDRASLGSLVMFSLPFGLFLVVCFIGLVNNVQLMSPGWIGVTQIYTESS